MKNVVKCYKEFFGYFNALETNGEWDPTLIFLHLLITIKALEQGLAKVEIEPTILCFGS